MTIKGATIGLAGLALAACSNTGVNVTPDFVQGTLMPLPPELAPPTLGVAPPVKVTGTRAVTQGAAGVVVQPNNNDVDGTTWIIRDVDHRKIYAVPVAPLAPTTILLPMGETLAAAVSGSTKDLTIGTAVSGDRAAITVMPNCASPYTKRFGLESDVPLERCMTDRAKATFLTSAGPYSFEFMIYDYASAQIVEVNHAPPPPTNVHGTAGRPPFPRGQAEPLSITPVGKWNPAWKPAAAYADEQKMVIRFPKPLPVLPGLWSGLVANQVINYSIIETETDVYMVTWRKVTEAELRVDDQTVRISSGQAQQLQNQEN